MEEILLSLSKLDYLSRSQIQRLHRLGTDRNARRVLADMSEFLQVFRLHENIYYLSKEGRDRVNCNNIRKKTAHVEHFLMRNDLYIHLGRPATWKNEARIKKSNGETLLVADAAFKRGMTHCFVEIDNTQKMSKNRSKIKRYKELDGMFKLIWLTTTEYRRKQLTEFCNGLDAQVMIINDIK